MAYTTIDKPTDYFNTLPWTGNGNSTRSITGVGFQPDLVWLKGRSIINDHTLYDSVRGAGLNKELSSDGTEAEGGLLTEQYGYISSIDSDGFSGAAGISGSDPIDYFNESGSTYASWNWLAGGSAPSQTYTVKVVSDGGNKYRFNDFGTSAVTLDLQEGGTYTFDQSDSSNSGHPLRFSTTSNGTHGGGSEYTTGVTTTGTPGSAGAKTVITVAASAPQLYYYCSVHSAMGGSANTNSTFGSSNFSGSIQSTVSANTTAGFSIVSYTGTGSASTIGHGLGATPQFYIVKNRSNSRNWQSYHEPLGNQAYLRLNTTGGASTGAAIWNNTSPTSSVFSIGTSSFDAVNASGDNYIAYCFAEKKGYSKFGSYVGNGSADGTFVYTGFKPAWIMYKRTDSGADDSWVIADNKRDIDNPVQKYLFADQSNAEGSVDFVDFTAQGFKYRLTGNTTNGNGMNYIYIAFAESPFVTSTGIPTTAR